MAYVLGNGITATFSPVTGSDVIFSVTGFSWNGGDRPEVDITTGASTRRKVLPGLASPEDYTLSVKYDTGVSALSSNPYSPEMIKCGAGTLLVNMAPATACGTPAAFVNGITVDMVSFNFSVELDGILEGEVTFRRRH
jgi:hypothetical protein